MLPPQKSNAPARTWFPFRGQKTRVPIYYSQLGISDSSFRSAEIISSAPTVNLVFVFQSHFAHIAKGAQTIRSEILRKRFLKNFSTVTSANKIRPIPSFNVFRRIPIFKKQCLTFHQRNQLDQSTFHTLLRKRSRPGRSCLLPCSFPL